MLYKEYLTNKDNLPNPDVVKQAILYKRECIKSRKLAVKRKRSVNYGTPIFWFGGPMAPVKSPVAAKAAPQSSKSKSPNNVVQRRNLILKLCALLVVFAIAALVFYLESFLEPNYSGDWAFTIFDYQVFKFYGSTASEFSAAWEVIGFEPAKGSNLFDARLVQSLMGVHLLAQNGVF